VAFDSNPQKKLCADERYTTNEIILKGTHEFANGFSAGGGDPFFFYEKAVNGLMNGNE
jgi:hypothetical protein